MATLEREPNGGPEGCAESCRRSARGSTGATPVVIGDRSTAGRDGDGGFVVGGNETL
jgi:hypothetical protein